MWKVSLTYELLTLQPVAESEAVSSTQQDVVLILVLGLCG